MIYSILRIVKYLGRKVESCLNLSIQKHSIKIENLPESHFYKDDSFFYSLVSIYKYFLKPSGWLESKGRNQSSRNGFAIPWITYSSFEIIDRMQLPKLTIVEFGAGASTHYFASKALKVISYEFDSDYLVTLEKGIKPNTSLRGPLHFPSKTENMKVDSSYREYLNRDLACGDLSTETANQIDWINLISDIKASVELADLVLIDGGPRTLVAKIVSEALGSSKLIVLDNSDRVHERDAVSVLQQQGYVEIPFTGLGPLNPYCWTTSFFVREVSTLRNLLYPE